MFFLLYCVLVLSCTKHYLSQNYTYIKNMYILLSCVDIYIQALAL